MESQLITLSSAGLKNIIVNSNQVDNEFSFIFGDKKIEMPNLYAEFISPRVSQLHKIDPTISFVDFKQFFTDSSEILSPFSNEFISEDIISHLKQISSGYSININQNQAFKLQIISLLLDNNELSTKISEHYPVNITENNLDDYLSYLQLFKNSFKAIFYFDEIINFISSNFSKIDKKKLLKLPKATLYLIITNKKFKIDDEDSFLDFINQIFSNCPDNNEESPSITDFYEEIEFMNLSEEKFRQFIESFDINEITYKIWLNLCKCFYFNAKSINKCKPYEYDGRQENCFRGIIHYLTEKCGGNVDEKGIVKVTSLTGSNSNVVVDLENTHSYFESKDGSITNQWLKYDFLNKKIRPTHYSVRSRDDGGAGYYQPQTWVIEGSNTDQDDDWKILDSQNEVKYLDGKSLSHTFAIETKSTSSEYYRYLRFRLTGKNTGNDNDLRLSALEFFGSIQE